MKILGIRWPAIVIERKILLEGAAIFLLALLVRILFVAFQSQKPVVFDEIAYPANGLGFGSYLLTGYIDPYLGNSFFLRGPFLSLVYDAVFAVYYWRDISILHCWECVARDFNWNAMRYLQAIVDSGTCVMTSLLGRQLFSNRVARLAGILAVFYPSFIFSVGQILPQVWAAFGLIGLAWLLLKALDRQNRALYFVAGLVLAVVSLILPEAIMAGLIIFWLVVLWIELKRDQRGANWRRIAVSLLAGYLLLIIPKYILAWRILGQFSSESSIVSPVGFWEILPSEGWVAGLKTPEFVSEINVASADGLTTVDHLRIAWHIFSLYPVEVVRVYGLNMLRLWYFPYNFFAQEFILDLQQQFALHWGLLLAALLGLPLAIATQRRATFLGGYPLYFTALYSLNHAETRYVVIAMPYIILGACFGIDQAYQTARTNLSERGRWIMAVGALAGGLSVLGLGLPFWAWIAPALNRYALLIIWLGCVLIAYSIIIWPLTHALILDKTNPAAQRGWIAGIILMAGGIVAGASLSPFWHQWSVRLAVATNYPNVGTAVIGPPPQVIEQIIELPARGLGNGQVRLLVDGASNDWSLVEVTVNGVVVKQSGEPWPARTDTLLIGNEVRMRFWGQRPEDVRQWMEWPIPPDLTAGASTIQVQMRVPKTSFAWLKIHGDFPNTNPSVFYGPSLRLDARGLSMYKLMWDLRDSRIAEATPLASRRTISRWFDGYNWRDDDLAQAPGRQTGQYRIRIAVVPGLPPDLKAAIFY